MGVPYSPVSARLLSFEDSFIHPVRLRGAPVTECMNLGVCPCRQQGQQIADGFLRSWDTAGGGGGGCRFQETERKGAGPGEPGSSLPGAMGFIPACDTQGGRSPGFRDLLSHTHSTYSHQGRVSETSGQALCVRVCDCVHECAHEYLHVLVCRSWV